MLFPTIIGILVAIFAVVTFNTMNTPAEEICNELGKGLILLEIGYMYASIVFATNNAFIHSKATFYYLCKQRNPFKCRVPNDRGKGKVCELLLGS